MKKTTAPLTRKSDLEKWGDGDVAYITTITSEEAHKRFPMVEGLPQDINLFALYGADGTPLALTDTKSAAIGHALGDELQIAAVH